MPPPQTRTPTQRKAMTGFPLPQRAQGPLGMNTPAPDYTRGDRTLDFIVGQMKADPGSKAGKEIKRHNDAVLEARRQVERAMKEMKEATGLKGVLTTLGGNQVIDSYQKAAMASSSIAALNFFNQVKPGGPWDYKKDLQRLLDPGILGSDYLPIMKDAYYPVRGIPTYEYYYDIWTNIHFGYVGRAVGFDEDTLFMGQNLQSTLGPLGEWLAGKNDEGDNISVKAGFALWDQQPDPSRLAVKHVVDLVRDTTAKWQSMMKSKGCKAIVATNNR